MADGAGTLPVVSEMQAGESVGEAWQTVHDQPPVLSEMQAGERISEASRLEVIGTKHDELPDVSYVRAGEMVGEVGWSVESVLVLCLWVRQSERFL